MQNVCIIMSWGQDCCYQGSDRNKIISIVSSSNFSGRQEASNCLLTQKFSQGNSHDCCVLFIEGLLNEELFDSGQSDVVPVVHLVSVVPIDEICC
jgi:hypothetical protein